MRWRGLSGYDLLTAGLEEKFSGKKAKRGGVQSTEKERG